MFQITPTAQHEINKRIDALRTEAPCAVLGSQSAALELDDQLKRAIKSPDPGRDLTGFGRQHANVAEMNLTVFVFEERDLAGSYIQLVSGIKFAMPPEAFQALDGYVLDYDGSQFQLNRRSSL